MNEIMDLEKCSHCGHEWLRRTVELPVSCPKCQRRYHGRNQS